MTSLLPLPKRRDEAWRYSDLAAVAAIWPAPPPQALTLTAGESRALHIIRDDQAAPVCDYQIVLQAGARLDITLLNLGGRLGRVSFDVTCHAGAHFGLNAAQIAGAGQTLEIVSTVRHIEPGGTSAQVVRSIAAAKAVVNVLGRVEVARGAQKIDASQSVKAMLLDRSAIANAKPELEIFADDVKCAHGATVGELDAGALFYLAARGIPKAAARTLLLQAFIGELFDDHDAEDELRAAALAKLETLI